MTWIALRMLTGDRQKFIGLIFGIAFSTLLITQQLTIFVNLIQRGSSAVYNVGPVDLWVMDPASRTTDVVYPMPSTALDRVRGVQGVEWAVPYLQSGATIRTPEGDLEGVTEIGVDDSRFSIGSEVSISWDLDLFGRLKASQLAAASDADLAATAAQRFPRFTLSSALGLLAFSLGGLFDSDAITASLGAGIAGPLLDFGRIQAEIDGGKAQTVIAFQELHKASFTALGQAESAFGRLAAADREASLLAAQAEREADVARVSASRYRAGLENLIAVLDADRTAYAAQQQAVAAKGRAQRARLALWQSLGGPGVAGLFPAGE